MDYQGRSIKDGSTDPSLLAAIVELQNEVDVLQETAIRLGRTDQLCSIEAEVEIPLSPGQESFSVKQPVVLIGSSPPLYSNGYASVPGVNLLGYASPYLYSVPNGVRWERTASDNDNPIFHVTGCATFELLFMTTMIALQMRYVFSDGRVVKFDQNILCVPDVRAPFSPYAYKIDAFMGAELDTFNAAYVDFVVVVKYDFGTSPTYTNTVTGGWDTQYRNFLRVQRVR